MPLEPPQPPHRKPEIPAVEGWFTLGAAPALVGRRCTACETVVFPPRALTCPNPRCDGQELAEVELGRTGRIWSYATNHYPPPAPYIAAEPFTPYTVAAVELDAERIVVLGQVPPSVDPGTLRIGQQVELAVGPLYERDGETVVVWQWAPRAEAAG